jgi:hypothetical protein
VLSRFAPRRLFRLLIGGEKQAEQVTRLAAASRTSTLRVSVNERHRVARERRLEAHQVEAIFRAFAEVMRELPPDTEAGWLDAEGDLRLAPDIGRKLRTARSVRDLLRQMREARDEGTER